MDGENRKAKIFSLSANRPLAEKIARRAGIPLSEVDVVKFQDGEMTTEIHESVRGHHVFIVQPTSKPANDHLMEVLILTDALKRASAASITVIMPYYGYSRQDRKARSRQPITAKLVANLLQVAGINRLVCIDLHASQIQGFFDIPIDNFPAGGLLGRYFNKKNIENIAVVSPDHGGVTRARMMARMFEAPLAIVDKRRPVANKAEVMNIIGDVEGKNCIIVDDIIDTGGTLIAVANELKKNGAAKIYATATHGVFSGEATQNLQESVIEEIVVTDTIYIPDELKRPKITQISIGHLLGQAIIHLLNDLPIGQVFNNPNPEEWN